MKIGMRSNRFACGAAIALAAGGLLASCGSSEDDSATAGASATGTGTTATASGSTIGFAYGFESSPVYATVLRPAKAEARRLGVRLLQGSANGRCDAQLRDLDNMIQSGADAITFLGLCGAGSAYDRPIALARREGVKMVSYAFAHPDADGSITFDDRQAGELTAADATRWLQATFRGDYADFRWGLLPCSAGPPIVQQRTRVVRAAIVGLTGVEPFEDADCALDPSSGQKAAENWLQKEPSLDMVIGINDAGALGAYQALKQSTTVDRDRLYVAGMDGQREAVELIQRGGDGIYRFTAAVPVCTVGRDVVRIPAGILSGSPEASSVVLKYVPLSVENRAAVRQFDEQQFVACG